MAYYHCLLFDVDGTLLDFNASEKAALSEMFEHYGFDRREEMQRRYQEINASLWAALERGEIKQDKLVVQRFEMLFHEFDIQAKAAEVNEFYLAQLAARADVFEGVQDILQELAEVATLAVVTNGVERVQRKRLDQAGLTKYFDGFFVSSKVGATKPSRKIFDAALRELGVENREKVLMIGDSVKADIVGGKNAGLATCFCNFLGQDASTVKATHTIEHLHELMNIVMEPEELANVGNPEKRHQV